MTQLTKRKLYFWLKLLFISILVTTIMVVTKYTNGWELLRSTLQWIGNLSDFQPIAFILIYNIATVLFVPGMILTMGSGILFGVIWGSIYAIIAAILGATGSFLIGRYLCREVFWRMIQDHPKFIAIDSAVAVDGLKIVLLTRLSPILPFNLLNYVFGITQVSLKDYILGSFGIIPGTVMYVYLGDLLGDLAILGSSAMPSTPEAQYTQWIIRVVSLGLTAVITLYLAHWAKKALKKIT